MTCRSEYGKKICIYLFEGKATRLAELALIFIPIYNVALSDKPPLHL